ncbi:terminase small subunit [Roseburia inulinivorans]|uniref:terminase small subunit n=1 Tax=Roseburia inulinivorans TaxID=360807 RepID=UPI0015F313F3|nr:terminase small subunit [Roseburia inulinivorans]
MENYEKAEQDYMAGMKYKDIAEKYGTTINTVKSWKKRYAWSRGEGAHKEEKVCTQKSKGAPKKEAPIDDGTKETLQNDDLTPEQQMFCIYYSRTFNAAQSYQKAYGCSYESAIANGSRLLTNDKVRAEIKRLKEIKRQQIVADADDIVELQMRIAFADIGNYVSFGQKEVTDIETDETYMVSVVDLKESKNTDTQLIQEVKRGKDGVSVKLADKQKAIDWLSKYFLVHPDDKYKAEFDKKRAEVSDNSGAQILQNMQTIVDILQHPVANRSISDLEEGDADE